MVSGVVVCPDEGIEQGRILVKGPALRREQFVLQYLGNEETNSFGCPSTIGEDMEGIREDSKRSRAWVLDLH